MIYQNVLCIGDSQTSGARSYFGYPEALAEALSERTGLVWNCVNAGVARETLIQIYRRTQHLVREFDDVVIACVLAGCNDTRMDRRTGVREFGMIYRQLLNLLRISRYVGLFVGTIPPIQDGFGFIPYDENSRRLREEYNAVIGSLCAEMEISLVDTTMGRENYVDAVHFNERGSRTLGARFADAILHVTEGKARLLAGKVVDDLLR
jgi:lysophospholipase L1-like esterase